MSDPLRPHKLREEIARGAGGEYVAARYAQMRCDGAGGRCKLPPIRAPRLVVGPTPWDFMAAPIWKFTTDHFCELHKHEYTLEAALNSPSPYGRWTAKRDIELIAKRKWPQGRTPDFDNAEIEWMLTTTPEYRRFLEFIEQTSGVMVDPWMGVPVS
jgi:hypothetical protein